MLPSSLVPDRLPFVLPEFLRLSWVTEAAHDVWALRLRAMVRAWFEIEISSAAIGARECALIRRPSQDCSSRIAEWSARGLRVLFLPDRTQTAPGQPEACASEDNPSEATYLVVGAGQGVARFHDAWMADDHLAMGLLLGYPRCCATAFVERHVRGSWLDPTWLMAASESTGGPLAEVAGSPITNLLWRWIGVRATPHLLCDFHCSASVELGRRFIQIGRESAYEAEMDWLQEVLSWPAKWSALHGIAEVKTPILKVTTRTDATATTYTVHWLGERFPEEGAKGVAFPYKTPERALLTESAVFRRAMKAVPDIVQIQPAR